MELLAWRYLPLQNVSATLTRDGTACLHADATEARTSHTGRSVPIECVARSILIIPQETAK